MKLRKRLATVLAVATIVSAVPMVTFAADDDGIRVNRNVTVAKNTTFTTTSSAVTLILDAPYIENGDVFYLTLENAEWVNGEDTVINMEGLEITCYNDTEAAVKVVDATVFTREEIRVPLLTKVTGGDAYVYVENGLGSVQEGKQKFATVVSGDEVFTVTAKDPNTFYDEGTLGDIVFSEILVNSTVGKSVEDRTVLIELNHPDFEFKLPSNGKIELKLSRGFLNSFSASTISVAAEYEDRDGQSISFVIPELEGDSKGVFTIEGLEVISTVKKPDLDDLTVDISGTLIGDNYDLKVATIAEYGSKLESKAVKIIAGRTEDIKFTLDEIVPDSMISGRYVDFEVSDGYIAVSTENRADDLALLKKQIKTLQSGENNLAFADVIEDVITKTIDDVEYIVGFEFRVPSEIDEFTFKMPLTTPLDAEGDIKVTASGRGIANSELETVVATVSKAIATEIKSATLKVGLAKQVGGEITITEQAAGVMERGKDLVFILESDSGLTLTDVPKIEVTSGDAVLDVDNAKITKVTLADGTKANALTVGVKRASKTASTVTISDFVITADRTVPEGSYYLEIGGSAITESNNLRVDDFIVIGTKNTEDLNGADQKAAIVSTFKVGAKYFQVNGQTQTMDAAAYMSDKNRTMVPVRYLATALGVDEDDIQYAAGVVTIFYGDDIVQLQRDKAGISVNGILIPTDEAITIKDGRAYAPIGELARILDLKVDWDSTTQTATFSNKAAQATVVESELTSTVQNTDVK